MEEASKMMAEGILAYVKAVVSHITQSTSQGSFQHKGIEQGAGSSRAGKTRRSIPTPPGLEERYMPPHRRDEAVFQRSPAVTCWIPRGQMFEARTNYGRFTTRPVQKKIQGNIGGSTIDWPRSPYFPRKIRKPHYSDNLGHQTPREFQKEKVTAVTGTATDPDHASRSTTGDETPLSACTRRPEEIGMDGFSSSRLAGTNSGETAAAAAA
ncbi:histone-lysine N-methyltransferase setd3-like [Dorcoceras hygrometricum]|uniref:Histone-lysine N-methyltransferase setd3-like n=1 Tax=Dorcoceras hygrometricum TaxID=472368 RepID=A0A2Z7CKH2_9LAMI|nr:histone-lysine N-methyltransferase setd3-like [Dorcoceras hygrometricum]